MDIRRFARDIARAALSDARVIDDPRVAAEALLALALATDDGEALARVALLEEGLALARVRPDPGLDRAAASGC